MIYADDVIKSKTFQNKIKILLELYIDIEMLSFHFQWTDRLTSQPREWEALFILKVVPPFESS